MITNSKQISFTETVTIQYDHISVHPDYSCIKMTRMHSDVEGNCLILTRADELSATKSMTVQGILSNSELADILEGKYVCSPPTSRVLVSNKFLENYKTYGLQWAFEINKEDNEVYLNDAYDKAIENPLAVTPVRLDLGTDLIYDLDGNVIFPGVWFSYIGSDRSIDAYNYDMAIVKNQLSAMQGILYRESSRSFASGIDELTPNYAECKIPYYQDRAGTPYVEMVVKISENADVVASLREALVGKDLSGPSSIAKALMEIDYFGVSKAGARLKSRPDGEDD